MTPRKPAHHRAGRRNYRAHNRRAASGFPWPRLSTASTLGLFLLYIIFTLIIIGDFGAFEHSMKAQLQANNKDSGNLSPATSTPIKDVRTGTSTQEEGLAELFLMMKAYVLILESPRPITTFIGVVCAAILGGVLFLGYPGSRREMRLTAEWMLGPQPYRGMSIAHERFVRAFKPASRDYLRKTTFLQELKVAFEERQAAARRDRRAQRVQRVHSALCDALCDWRAFLELLFWVEGLFVLSFLNMSNLRLFLDCCSLMLLSMIGDAVFHTMFKTQDVLLDVRGKDGSVLVQLPITDADADSLMCKD